LFQTFSVFIQAGRYVREDFHHLVAFGGAVVLEVFYLPFKVFFLVSA